MAYINLLTRIKNARMAKKDGLKVPFSRNDFAIAEILMKNGFLKSIEKKGRLPRRIIDIELNDNFEDFKLISKPSRRSYIGYKDLKPVRSGYGIGVVSTSKGMMTAREAKKEKIGGELLFEVW